MEYIAVPFYMMRYGVTVDFTPRTLGGEGDFFVDKEHPNFWMKNENISDICTYQKTN